MWQPQSPGDGSRSPVSQIENGASSRQRVVGRRFAQIIRLRPECVEEYKACHAKVWPDVLKQIKECNIEDYSIWYDDKSGILFASFKYLGYNYAGDMERMAANPKVKEWWKMTDAMQESFIQGAVSSEAGEPGWWKPIEEVFYTP